LADAVHLQTLVDRFGAADVWHTGIDVLGYPPSWLVGVDNALRIATALEERFGQ
jgi:L-alanine-DL-glutamate epimerase-like enolase superfamily enzyme